MYSLRERDAAYRAALADFIAQQYEGPVARLEPAERGWYGETWIVEDGKGGRRFAKLIAAPHHAARFRMSFPVLRHLHAHGIDYVSEALPNRRGEDWSCFRGDTLALFRFVEGLHTEDYELRPFVEALARIYRVPTAGLQLPLQVYDARDVEKWKGLVAELATQPGSAALLGLLNEQRSALEYNEKRLARIIPFCQREAGRPCVTSGDVGGNIILKDGRMTIIDWDDCRLAPPERDMLWYLQGAQYIATINMVLQEQGLATLAPARLAYFAYARHFFHLREYVCAWLELPDLRENVEKQVEAYLAPDHFMARVLEGAEGI